MYAKQDKLEQSTGIDTKHSDKLPLEAKLKKDLSLLYMANSLKDVIKNNKAELKKLEQEENGLKSDSCSSDIGRCLSIFIFSAQLYIILNKILNSNLFLIKCNSHLCLNTLIYCFYFLHNKSVKNFI